MLEFEWPWLFVLLPLPLLLLFFQTSRQQTDGAIFTPHFQEWQGIGTQNVRGNFQPFNLLVQMCIWTLLLIAAARPMYVGQPIQLPAEGRDLMLAIDTSSSMLEEDMTLSGRRSNRFEVVRHVLSQFISRREGDKLGLILFGKQAFLQCPLTFDHKTVTQFLDEAFIGMAIDGTAIGDSIGIAIKRFKQKEVSNRALILLTDGQSNAGVDPIEAAKKAAEESITIYTIGIGADRFSRRSFRYGALDENTLKKVASLTGGQYFRARNQRELVQIYQELDKLEPIASNTDTFRPTKALFFYPLGLALLLLLIHLLKPCWHWSHNPFPLKEEQK